MAGWDFGTNSGDSGQKLEFTKFIPGGTVKLRVVGEEPYSRWTHWQPAHSRSINCPGRGCPICEIRTHQKANKEPYTQSVSRRFSILVLNRDTNKLEILEQGKTFFEDLRDIMIELKEKDKSLLDVDIKVRRRGASKDDTVYRIDVGDEYPLSESDKKLIENMVDLNEFYKPHTPEQILRILNGETWESVMKKEEVEDDNVEEEIELK